MLLRSRAQCWAKVVRVAVTEYVRVLDTMTRVSRQTLDVPAGEALTLAQKDLAQNWSQYREEFVRRMR